MVYANRMKHSVNFKRMRIALEVFGSVPFPVTTEYVPIKKASRSKTATLARRLYFDSYYSFVMTNFFEGLHYGHYPRRCGIFKKYFLMTSAARQKYCTGYAPFKLKGKAITCRKYAARINRKELAAGNPVSVFYMDYDDLDEYGEPKKKPIKTMMYTDIATDHEYSSANTAHNKYQKALDKLRKAIEEFI